MAQPKFALHTSIEAQAWLDGYVARCDHSTPHRCEKHAVAVVEIGGTVRRAVCAIALERLLMIAQVVKVERPL